MTPRLKSVLAFALASLALPACAQAPDAAAKATDDRQFCYALALMSKMTVLNRNGGKTFDEQMERRRKRFDPQGNHYKLLEEITRQVYDRDMRDDLAVTISTHRSCLQAKEAAAQYSDAAMAECPAIGSLVTEVSQLRRLGGSVEQVVKIVGTRYRGLEQSYGGGVAKLAEKYQEGDQPQTGEAEYQACMLQGTK